MSTKGEHKEIILNGISASPGICIGKAYLVDREGVDVIKRYHIDTEDLQNEVTRFKVAVKQAKDELHAIIKETSEDLQQHADILETQVVVLEDKMLYGRTIETIEKEQINAEWALKKVVSKVKSMFQDITDAYLKDRTTDIEHVSDRIMRHLVGAEPVNIAEIDKRVILIAHDLSPAQTSQINLERIMGFVTVLGGVTSHTSIIARSLGIPAVQGIENASRLIQNDDIIIVDGSRGNVFINPSEPTLVDYMERQVRFESFQAGIARSSHQPAKTTDGHQVKVMGNIELSEQVVAVMDNGGEGVGLFRTEFQYLSSSEFPGEDELFEKYKEVVEVMPNKPVTIRTLDINGDKTFARNSGAAECNPALGLRAIRYCLKRPDIFKTQLRAILRAAVFGEVRLLLPMLATLDELMIAKSLIEDAIQSLEDEDQEYNCNIDLGVMIEVPSLAVMADVIAREVDFFSIGTNDLIQYSMAVDRGNREVAYLYNPLHPAILRTLKFVSDAAKQEGIKLFMCGEMAGDPFSLPVLLGLGIDELSMTPQSIPVLKNMIRSISMADARTFMQEILKQTSARAVTELIQINYGGIISETIFPE
ncbi:MAG: phosphoenolpyruvate--protein phosphotransferase [Deltaproteobacteria bacterium]|nr:MAG: phosphoenolpyruvate--protein phosphotransferase [Deltaproteobacteria bacterium]